MTKILVVDDEMMIREVLVDLLTDEGYHVVAVTNGQRALEVLPLEQPDLVIIDIMMPGLDGREVVRRMRETNHLPPIPVIIMSAAIAMEPPSSPATLFLPKPFDIDELLNSIERLLSVPPHPFR